MVDRAAKMVLYLLVTDGLLALLFTEAFEPIFWLVVPAGVAASWRWRLRHPSHRSIPLLILALSLGEVLLFPRSLLLWALHLLVFLIFYKLFARDRIRDDVQLALMSLMALIGATALTSGLLFLAVYLLYVPLAVWTAILLYLREEREQEPGLVRGSAPLPPRFFLLTGGVSLGALLLVCILFLFLPRLGVQIGAAGPARSSMVSGFAEKVTLGDFGRIDLDSTVTMRVEVSGGPVPTRWRGVAFERFDGQAWHRGESIWALRGWGDRPFRLSRVPGRGRIRQDITLEPIGTPILFATPRVVEVRIDAPALFVDQTGSLRLTDVPPAVIRYTAYSEPEPATRDLGEDGPRPPGIERYLQLPPLSPRVRAMAYKLGGGAKGAWEKARRIESYLSTQYTYSLHLRRDSRFDPVEDFLFVQKRGHCEYFATSMAILLRVLGVPARVVNGFQQGVWNPFGEYFAVRQQDAHSWVEAFVPGRGWISFDPSPRAAFEAEQLGKNTPSPAWQYLDYLKLRWNRYVVGYNRWDQLRLTRYLLHPLRRVVQSITPMAFPWTAWGLGVLLLAGGLWLGRRLLGWSRAAGPFLHSTVPIPFYEEMRQTLERRGHRRPSHLTPWEFALEIHGVVPELTRLYYAVRYGERP
ncbi:MAG: DUF3488 and DUF4129 domain-containing transglutaminase family protein, partial [Candidatus Methylomirabilales bacterium]